MIGNHLLGHALPVKSLFEIIIEEPLHGVYARLTTMEEYYGVTYLFLGSLSGDYDLLSADAKYVGFDDSGRPDTISTADLDGDGIRELIIGATSADFNVNGSGAVFVLFDKTEGTINLSKSDYIFVGEAGSDYAGSALATGDVDGDNLT